MYRLDGQTFGVQAPASPEPLAVPAYGELSARDRFLGERMRAALAEHGATAASLAIARDGEIVYAEGFGETTEGGEPVTADTLFRVGSVGKLFNAVAMMQLASSGRLDLDAPVAQTFGGALSEVDPRITSRMLLSHTAGVPDDGGCQGDLATPTEYVRAHASDPVWSPPGALFNYSNAGMTYAGAVLESITGRSYTEYVEEAVFGPAGMVDATFDVERARALPHAVGHAADGTPIPEELSCGLIHAAGGAFVSARDLVRFALALMSDAHALLPEDALRELLTPAVSMSNGGRDRYGLGVMLRSHGALQVAFHPGGMPGWTALLAFIPEEGFAAAVVANGPELRFPLGMLSLYYPLDDELPVGPDPLDDAVLREAVGTYRDPYGWFGRIRVELRDGQLSMVPLGGQRQWPIGIAGTFWPDEAGRTTYFATRVGVAVREDDR